MRPDWFDMVAGVFAAHDRHVLETAPEHLRPSCWIHQRRLVWQSRWLCPDCALHARGQK